MLIEHFDSGGNFHILAKQLTLGIKESRWAQIFELKWH